MEEICRLTFEPVSRVALIFPSRSLLREITHPQLLGIHARRLARDGATRPVFPSPTVELAPAFGARQGRLHLGEVFPLNFYNILAELEMKFQHQVPLVRAERAANKIAAMLSDFAPSEPIGSV